MYIIANNEEDYNKWKESHPTACEPLQNYPFTIFWHEVPFEYEYIEGDLSIAKAKEQAEIDGRILLTKARTYIPGIGVTIKVVNIFGVPHLTIDSRSIESGCQTNYIIRCSKEILLDLAATIVQGANAKYEES